MSQVTSIKRMSREIEIPTMRIVSTKKVYSRKVKHSKGGWSD